MVRSERYAGKRVVVNDALVEFADDGTCIGIVAYGGGRQPLEQPDELRPQDLDVMRQFPDRFTIEGKAPMRTEAPPDDQGVDETENPEPPRTQEGDVEELMALYSRDELAQMAKEAGLHVTRRATKRQLAEMLAGDEA